MNPVIHAIKSRISIRKYLDTPLSKDAIDTLIDSAKYAPSGMNEQPWGFIVVQDKKIIKELSDRAIPYINKLIEENPKFIRYKRRMKAPDFSIFYHAPCLIIVLGRTDAFFYKYDCAMSAQNIMLTACSMNIGACWVGMMEVLDKDPWFRQKFQIPDNYTITAPLALGYFDPKDIQPIDRKPIEILKYF